MKEEYGIHSLSLAVKDIEASKSFYEKLGFEALTEFGSIEEKWLIMKRGDYKSGYSRICLKKISSPSILLMPDLFMLI